MIAKLFGRKGSSYSSQQHARSTQRESENRHAKSASGLPHDLVMNPPLHSNAFDPARHLRIYIAQDPLVDKTKIPLFDSHYKPPRATTISSIPHNGANDSFLAGLTPDRFPEPVFRDQPPHTVAFTRLLDLMFGSVPMSYKGTSTKIMTLSSSDDRCVVLVTKLFAVGLHHGPKYTYTDNSYVPSQDFIYPHVRQEADPDQSPLCSSSSTGSSALPAEHGWAPVSAPGDSLPEIRGRALFFALGIVVSLPRDKPNLISTQWNLFSRAIDDLARIAFLKIQSEVLAKREMMTSAYSNISVPVALQNIRIAPTVLQSDSDLQMSAASFADRFVKSMTVPRLKHNTENSNKWAFWRSEATAVSNLLSDLSPRQQDGQTFLETLLASFLCTNTESPELPSTRTVIIGSSAIANRILFLVSSFLSSPDSVPRSPVVTLAARGRYGLDIPGVSFSGHSQLLSGSYISSIWSSQSALSSTPDGSVMESATSLSSTSSSASTLDDNDCDFFGSWEDTLPQLSATTNCGSPFSTATTPITSFNVRPKYTVTRLSDNTSVLDVALPPRYADVRVPSLSSTIPGQSFVSSVKLSPAFHPDFRVQAADSTSATENRIYRALCEDADYSNTCLRPNVPTVVARTIVASIQSLKVEIWSLSRTLLSNGQCEQKIIKRNANAIPEWNISRLWVDGDGIDKVLLDLASTIQLSALEDHNHTITV
ncbi:hypothetical protein V1511DRAFT_462804 [Dipodascopsis uninucleata]